MGVGCSVDDCPHPVQTRGWCGRHYNRVLRHGSPHVVLRVTKEQVLTKTRGATREYKQQWIAEYKLSHGCADCGYAEHVAALDFDHRPGTTKVRDIKHGNTLGWEALLAEVAKCDVVCANCHRVRTYLRYGDREEVVQ